MTDILQREREFLAISARLILIADQLRELGGIEDSFRIERAAKTLRNVAGINRHRPIERLVNTIMLTAASVGDKQCQEAVPISQRLFEVRRKDVLLGVAYTGESKQPTLEIVTAKPPCVRHEHNDDDSKVTINFRD